MARAGWRRAAGFAVAIGIIGTSVVGALALWGERADHPTSDDASIDADVVHVAPSVSGRIVRLPVIDNEAVTTGQELFAIDPDPFRLRVELAQAQLRQAEAILDTQRRSVATETSNAAIAGDEIKQATASLQLATNTVSRLEPLLGKGYVSQQQVDDARTAKRKAETALVQAEVQAASTRTAIGNTDSAAADVEARRRTLALAERDLRLTVIRAEHDGRVTGLDVVTGEYVTTGQTLFTLVVTDDWYATANFRESQLAGIRVGGCATAYSMIDRSVPIRGQIDGIGFGVRDQDRVDVPRSVPYVQKSVNWVRVEQRFPVRVRLAHPPEALMRLGASAVVRIDATGSCP